MYSIIRARRKSRVRVNMNGTLSLTPALLPWERENLAQVREGAGERHPTNSVQLESQPNR